MASLPSCSSTVNCHCHCPCYGGFKNNIISTPAIMTLLPDKILMIILNKLDLVEFHRVGAVCRLWRHKLFKPKFLKPQFPLLMLSFSESRRDLDHQGFFSAFHDKVYDLKMPKLRGARCCGSNWGWLIMLGNVEGCMFLYNPFTRVRIELPPKSTVPRIHLFDYCHPNPDYIRKAMLLSPASATANNFNLDKNKLKLVASSGDCLVIALYLGHHLAFCRPGNQAWTVCDGFINHLYGIEDFIVYDGRLYAIRQNFDLILLELLPQIRETSCNIAPPSIDLYSIYPGGPCFSSLYLVESRGELLMVKRWIKSDSNDPQSFTTYMFWVFKLDLQQRCWIKVEDLGDQMLFIGTSTGLSCSEIHYDGFKRNSIYFTCENFYHCSASEEETIACDDLGVFHLEHNSIEYNLYPTYFHSHVSPPIWFAPIPWYEGEEDDLWTVQLSKRVAKIQVSRSPQTSNQQVRSIVNCHCHCHCHGGFKNNNIIAAMFVAALPEEILMIILNKLDLVEFHRIGAVCRLWRDKLFKPGFLKPQFPWLMLSFSESKRYLHHQGFFSAFHGKVYNLEMPKLRGARCCGSNWGWLIMLGNVEGFMFLYNPFTRVHIELPHKSTLPFIPHFEEDYLLPNYIDKAMLLSPASDTASNFNLDENKFNMVGSPSSVATNPDDYLVVALYLSHCLTFCRLGDRAWTHDYIKYPKNIEDFIVYDGRLYAIKTTNDLVLLDLLPQVRETSCNIAPPSLIDLDLANSIRGHYKYRYLVEFRGELLMIIRWTKFGSFYSPSPSTVMFWLFKLDLQHQRWVRVEDLGDQMIFIGTNTGFSCSALQYDGFKGNCIYFTDQFFYFIRSAIDLRTTACDDLGVFHLEDNRIEFNICPTYFHSYMSPPVWFAPIP